jgi:hypothetical protein
MLVGNHVLVPFLEVLCTVKKRRVDTSAASHSCRSGTIACASEMEALLVHLVEDVSQIFIPQSPRVSVQLLLNKSDADWYWFY